MKSLVSGAIAIVVGAMAAGVTVFSLVSSTTAAPSQSPGDATQSGLVQYGTN